MRTPRVENMLSSSGREVANQFRIVTEDGVYFQSYASLIAFKPNGSGKIQLDRDRWDYSKTTGRYRNLFLRETKVETEKKIKAGVHELVNLNEG